MKWFKFYSEFRADPKLSLMTPHQQWAFIILLCLASEGTNRGRIEGLTDEELAFQLKMPVGDWEALKTRFKMKGMIDVDEFGLFITYWKDYLPPLRLGQNHLYAHHKDFVFSRDEFKCVYCGSRENLTLDHVIPQSKDGSHDPENLATCCSSCNSSKGAKSLEEWLGGAS
jgi:uncharacterized protein YihD (DUF1040 family)